MELMTEYKIIDTNIFLTDSDAITGFKNDSKYIKLIIPISVLHEIDRIKDQRDFFTKERTYKAMKAQKFAKKLSEFFKDGGNLNDGIKIDEKYEIISDYAIEKEMGYSIDDILTQEKTDTRLLKLCGHLKKKGEKVELVTSDINLANIANSIGVEANPWKDYVKNREISKIYHGWRYIVVDEEIIHTFYSKKEVSPDFLDLKLYPNEYIIANSNIDSQKSFLARFDSSKNALVPLYHYEQRLSRYSGKNVPQKFLMDALRNPDINLIFCFGLAGCGKTFLSVEAAIEQFISPKFNGAKNKRKMHYEKLLLTKPIVGHNKEEELGFLPGNQNEKVNPWISSFDDQFGEIFDKYGIDSYLKQNLFEEKIIEVQLLRHIRGRSLPNLYWIVDEAQNIYEETFDAILTRPNGNAKLIISGDPEQSDLKVPKGVSPLLYVNEIMKPDTHSATIYFNNEKFIVRDMARRYLKLKKDYEQNK